MPCPCIAAPFANTIGDADCGICVWNMDGEKPCEWVELFELIGR